MELKESNSKCSEVAKRICQKLAERYGETIDKGILDRVNEEMDWFAHHLGLEWLEEVARFIQSKKEAGEYIIPRLFVNNSFLLYLLGVATVNPLPAHRYCPRHHQFSWDSSLNKVCPECGETLVQDGFDLDFAFFAKAMSKEKATLDFSGTCEGNPDLRIRFVAQQNVVRAMEMAKRLSITQENLETNPAEESLAEIIRCAAAYNGYYFDRYTRHSSYARPLFVGLPSLGDERTYEGIGVFYPRSLDQLADLYAGFRGRGVYSGNFLFLEPDSSPLGFAFSCETVLRFLLGNEVDKRWALRIIGELRDNYEGKLSEESETELRELAWPEDYISFLKGITYLFFKGHEVAELRLELRLAEAFLNDPARYYEALFSADKEVLEGARKAYSTLSDWRGTKTSLSEGELAVTDMMERGMNVSKILGL